MLKIIIADAGHAELIADLSQQTYYTTYADSTAKSDLDKFINEIFTKEALMKEVGAAGNIFLLAINEKEALGYARLRFTEKTGDATIEIARLYLVAHVIGKGIGSALMKECFSVAKALNRKVVRLSVWEKNERAFAFYQKWGFEKTGEEKFILGNDVQLDWIMQKEL